MTPRRDARGVASSAALATHFAGSGLVTYPPQPNATWPAYIESLPDEPDQAVLVVTRPGPPPDTASAWSFPQLGVVLRAPAGASLPVKAFAAQLLSAVHGTNNTVWAQGTEHELHVTACEATFSEAIPLPPDARGRQRWSFGLQLEVNTDPL